MKIFVVKFGGNAISNEQVLDSLIADTIALQKENAWVVLVHGGGTFVNEALKEVGKSTTKIQGLRVTDEETLDIAVRTFSNLNEHLCKKFQEQGVGAISLCSKTHNVFKSKKMELTQDGEKIDLGWVGEIKGVDPGLIESWMFAGWLPIISPFGSDEAGNLYNLNADHAALAVAKALNAHGLFFMTDVSGVLKNLKDKDSIIPHLTPQSVQCLIDEGTISGGMLPKIKSCVEGVTNGVDQISILNSFEPHALLKAFATPNKMGTLITAA